MGRKVVILGGKGMLGSDLAGICKEQKYNVSIFDLPEFDITKADDIKRALDGADVVINCAAYTNVENAESQSDLANKINGDAVGLLGKIAADMGVWVLHISTDFVFDGKLDRPYNETDRTNPLNAYGKSKLAGEKLIAGSGCDYCIMRCEWTYGKSGNNFVKKLITAGQKGGLIKVVDDQVGSPTATTEAAKAICKLIGTKPKGIFHFACGGYVSRYDMAKFIFDKMAIKTDLSRCKSSEFVSKAIRPLNSRFDCGKIIAMLGQEIEHWQVSLERYLSQL